MNTFNIKKTKRSIVVKHNDITLLFTHKLEAKQLPLDYPKDDFYGFSEIQANNLVDAFAQFESILAKEKQAREQKKADYANEMAKIQSNIDNSDAGQIFALMCYLASKGEGWSLTRFIINTHNALTKRLHELLGNTYTFSPFDDNSFVIKGANGKRISNFRNVKNQIFI